MPAILYQIHKIPDTVWKIELELDIPAKVIHDSDQSDPPKKERKIEV